MDISRRLDNLIRRRYHPKNHPQFFKADGSPDIENFSKATRELRAKEITSFLDTRAKDKGYASVEDLLKKDPEMNGHKEMLDKMTKKASVFWNGFEKSAAKKEKQNSKKKDFGIGLAKNMGGNIAAGAASAGAMVGGVALEGKISDSKFDSLSKAIKRQEGIDPAVFKGPALQSQFDPKSNIVSSGSHNSLLGHELGHASVKSDKGNKALKFLRRTGAKGYMPARLAGGAAALSAIGMSTSDNEKINKIAPYVPLAVASPILAEEGVATFKGLKNIKKHVGGKAALKAALPLAVGFGSYLAAPLIAGAVAKGITKRRMEKKAGLFNKMKLEHVITGKGSPKIPVNIELGDKTLKTIDNLAKGALAVTGGFAAGSVLGKVWDR